MFSVLVGRWWATMQMRYTVLPYMYIQKSRKWHYLAAHRHRVNELRISITFLNFAGFKCVMQPLSWLWHDYQCRVVAFLLWHIRGFAFMRYINPRLIDIDTLYDLLTLTFHLQPWTVVVCGRSCEQSVHGVWRCYTYPFLSYDQSHWIPMTKYLQPVCHVPYHVIYASKCKFFSQSEIRWPVQI